jgi:hypothetical protein
VLVGRVDRHADEISDGTDTPEAADRPSKPSHRRGGPALRGSKPLSPYEEAKAVHAMLDRGLTDDGAAQALGWPKARVTARVKVLIASAAIFHQWAAWHGGARAP